MMDIWARVHTDSAEFEREAKNSLFGPLGAKAGMLPPIHKHFAEPNIEREAFKLKKGEVSPLIALEDKTTVILQCEKVGSPADTTKNLDTVRMQLYREIYEAKLPELVKATFAKKCAKGGQNRKSSSQQANSRLQTTSAPAGRPGASYDAAGGTGRGEPEFVADGKLMRDLKQRHH